MQLLADYGIPTVDAVPIAPPDGLAEALVAAEKIGYPVALKTAAPEIAHKTEAGGVRLGLADPQELTDAYEDLTSRLGPMVTVAAMAPAGVEVALGIVSDPTFGPLVLVAAGGILVELLHDRALAMPPLDRRRRPSAARPAPDAPGARWGSRRTPGGRRCAGPTRSRDCRCWPPISATSSPRWTSTR